MTARRLLVVEEASSRIPGAHQRASRVRSAIGASRLRPRCWARFMPPRSRRAAVRRRRDQVQPDTIVCIIEVMKMMNSIPAGVAGTIVEMRPENAQLVEYGETLFRVGPAWTATRDRRCLPRDRVRRYDHARRQPEPVERHRPDHAGRRGDRPDAGPGGLPRARLHLEHAHGGVGPLPSGGPVGADPSDERRDAEHAAGDDRDRDAVHLVGARRRGCDPAVVAAGGPQRDPALPDRRPFQRSAAPQAAGGDGAARRGSRRS